MCLPSINFLHLTVSEIQPGQDFIGQGHYGKVKSRSHHDNAQLHPLTLFIYLEFYVAFNTVQVISRRVVGRAEETSTYSSLGFCTVNCRPTASNYQLSHLRPCRGSNPGLRGGRQECYHSATVAPLHPLTNVPTKYQLPNPYSF